MRRLRLLVLALLIAAAGDEPAAGATRLGIARSSSLRLDGSSNVADWRCSGKTLSGSADVDVPIENINEILDRIEDGNIGIWMKNPGAATLPPPRFELEVPVAALRCSGGRRMESDVRRSLRSETSPVIRFRLIGIRGAVHHDIDRGDYEARIAGSLSLAGTTREIEVTVRARRLDRGRFRIEATIPLRMTDFGITPPAGLFGLIRARDELVVRFDLTLET